MSAHRITIKREFDAFRRHTGTCSRKRADARRFEATIKCGRLVRRVHFWRRAIARRRFWTPILAEFNEVADAQAALNVFFLVASTRADRKIGAWLCVAA